MSQAPANTYAANLRSAVNVAKTRLNLNDTDPALWSYEIRTQYNLELAQIITANPARFAVGVVNMARSIISTGYEPLANVSFDWTVFGDELAERASKIGFTVSTAVIAGLIVVLLAPHIRKALA
jgi:hypothetical protein